MNLNWISWLSGGSRSWSRSSLFNFNIVFPIITVIRIISSVLCSLSSLLLSEDGPRVEASPDRRNRSILMMRSESLNNWCFINWRSNKFSSWSDSFYKRSSGSNSLNYWSNSLDNGSSRSNSFDDGGSSDLRRSFPYPLGTSVHNSIGRSSRSPGRSSSSCRFDGVGRLSVCSCGLSRSSSSRLRC